MKQKLWNKDFILLLQGNTVSTIGDLMYSVAIGYWVYEQTGSSGLMGIMSAISMFVSMFLSPFSGSIVDKCNRKWVLVGMDVMQGVVMLGIGVLAYWGKLNVAGVLIAAFLAALGSVFYAPAVSTLMIDIIPHDDMTRGQSIFSGSNALISMVGTAFSGVMVAFFGVPLIVVINGLSNLYSAFSELFIHVPRTVQQGAQISAKSILRDSKAAVGMIFSDPCLRLFVPCALILNLLGSGPLALVLPFCMEKGFTVDMYGYLMAVWTAASLICVLVLGVVKLKPEARFWVMAIGFTGSVLFFGLTYIARHFVPLCVMAFLASFTNSAGNTIFNASLVLALPEENRGAILGFIQSASIGGTALSAVLYGVLGDVLPLSLVFSVGNLLSLGPMLYLCFTPRTKEFVLNH
ncbi:MAG: MFS transporter [Oscillospiraceae bacterium]|nr:MFS transporter [Oscillospiraceae bacterium]